MMQAQVVCSAGRLSAGFQVVVFGCFADVIQCIVMECSASVPALGCLHPQWGWCEFS